MKKLIIYMIIIITALAVIPALAFSKPDNIIVIPRSGDRIDLFWQGEPEEAYDIWQSTDGSAWEKIYTTETFVENYSVTKGIEPYVNYYFLVSTKDTVTDPVIDAAVTNSTYVGPAYPPNQIPHYFYTKDTNLCANCHDTHTSIGKALLKYEDVDDLCLTCHDGSQSKYNVLDGVVSRDGTWNDPLQSAGGPFGKLSGHTSNVVAESLHTLGTSPNLAPGGNPNVSGRDLSCVSCHSAHNTNNYRIIATETPESSNVRVVGYSVTDHVYGIERGNYLAGMDSLCMGCHPDYMAAEGAGSEPATGTYVTDGKYRHPIGVSPSSRGLSTTLPLQGDSGDKTDYVFCLTCHSAHGSSAETALNDTNDEDGNTTAVNYLLRRDYWAVCQDCHQK